MAQGSNAGNARGELSDEHRKQLADMLSILLADIHQLYIKTLAYHWNVEDPRFFQLHELFDKQYHQLGEDLDIVAERIRMIGHRSPMSIASLLELKRLQDTADLRKAQEMIQALLSDYELLIQWLREDSDEALNLGDSGTSDMLIQLLREFEKNAWFLRSHLEG